VLLTVVVVAALAAPVVVAVVARLTRDSPTTTATAPRATPSPTPSPTPTARPSRSSAAGPTPSPRATPTAKSTAKPTATATPRQRTATCWDGSQARRVSGCTEPQGVPGLTWVFPSMKVQRCGPPEQANQRGLVLRILCRARLRDGSPVVLGYTQWRSVDAAVAYFHRLRLASSELTGRGGKVIGYRYLGRSHAAQKAASLYADEPYSVALELSFSADATAAFDQVVHARPAGQVRGEPAR
jgi:hypothetical protein